MQGHAVVSKQDDRFFKCDWKLDNASSSSFTYVSQLWVSS